MMSPNPKAPPENIIPLWIGKVSTYGFLGDTHILSITAMEVQQPGEGSSGNEPQWRASNELECIGLLVHSEKCC